MKKFKHKSTGNIATETHSGKNYKVTDPKSFAVPKWIIENSNEWEEVEKEYQILRYYCKSKGSDDGNHIHYSQEIKSIKRLSDGEVFTLGDKVKDPTGLTFTISRFYPDCNDNHLLANDDAGRGHISITKIEKVKTPLFTTEDGVDIYEGDRYYSALYSAGKPFACEPITASDKTYPGKKFAKYESVDRYIKYNQPEYSKQDMISFGKWAKNYLSPIDVKKAFDKWEEKSY